MYLMAKAEVLVSPREVDDAPARPSPNQAEQWQISSPGQTVNLHRSARPPAPARLLRRAELSKAISELELGSAFQSASSQPPSYQGPKGDPGNNGVIGAQGAKGDPGDSGTEGLVGTQGANGTKGQKGQKGSWKGDRGPIGEPGELTLAADANCTWGDWTNFISCTVTCGSGMRTMERFIKQFPTGSGTVCAGSSLTVVPCTLGSCQGSANCQWTEWNAYSVCSSTCLQIGRQSRDRSYLTYAANNGADCAGGGPTIQWQKCGTVCADLPVACVWGSWTSWTQCPVSCNGAYQRSERSIQVWPQNGGALCNGTTFQTQLCNTQLCPDPAIDCQWGAWTDWFSCTESCASGTTTRERYINVYPQNEGQHCLGSPFEIKPCVFQFKTSGPGWVLLCPTTTTTTTLTTTTITKIFQEFLPMGAPGPAGADAPLRGPMGAVGPRGPTGDPGPKGQTGPAGFLGDVLPAAALPQVQCRWGAWIPWGPCTCGFEGESGRGTQVSVRNMLVQPQNGAVCNGYDHQYDNTCKPCVVTAKPISLLEGAEKLAQPHEVQN